MPVPNSMADLATLAGSNFPTGTEAIGNSLDNYLRAHGAIIRSTNALASSTIASASTTDIGSADGEAVGVTGTATINSLGTGFTGCYREVTFTGAATLTNSANLQLPNGANIVTATGDVIGFRCKGAGVWQMTGRWDGLSLRGGTLTGLLNGVRYKAVSPSVNPSTVDNMSYVAAGSYGGGYGFINVDNGQCSGIFHEANTLVLITSNNNVLSGSSRVTLDTSGNFVASGNITANSDERLKRDWRDLPADFLHRLARVKRGVYDRTDVDSTQVGVSAQSLREVLPWAVHEAKDGGLSVAYGNAALVASVELAERLVEIERRLAALGGD